MVWRGMGSRGRKGLGRLVIHLFRHGAGLLRVLNNNSKVLVSVVVITTRVRTG